MKLKKILIFVFAFLLVMLPTGVYADSSDNFEIISKDKDNNTIYGFKYELYDTNRNRLVKTIDLTRDSSYSTNLDDGEYKLVEIERPEGYDKAKDVEFKLPTKDGSGSIKLTPKHIKSTEKPKKNETKFTKSNTATTYVPMLLALGMMLGFVLVSQKSKKHQQC